MAMLKNRSVLKRGRVRAIAIHGEEYQRRQGFITSAGPWALFPHAEEETFWPGVEYASPVKILNADGTVREVVSALDFRSRRIAGQPKRKPKPRLPNGRFR